METSPRYVVFWMTTVLLLEFVAVNFIHFDIDRLGSASPLFEIQLQYFGQFNVSPFATLL